MSMCGCHEFDQLVPIVIRLLAIIVAYMPIKPNDNELAYFFFTGGAGRRFHIKIHSTFVL